MAGHARVREALQIAASEGAAEAARRTGVKAGTIRSAMARGRAKAARAAESVPPVPAVLEGEVAGGLEGLRQAYEAARKVEAQAVASTSALLAAGRGTEARNVATAGAIWSDKALALGKEIARLEAEQEREGARLVEEAVELQRGVLEALFRALGVPVPAVLLGELASRAAAGAPLVVGEAVARDALETMTAALREGVRAEVADLFGALGVSAGIWEEMAERLVAGEAVPAEVAKRFHDCLLADATVARGERLRAAPEDGEEPEPRRGPPLPRQEGFLTVKRVDPNAARRAGKRMPLSQRIQGGW